MNINTLKLKITTNRSAFIKGLKDAGYVNKVVNRCAFDDNELLRLAIGIYSDVWETFNKEAFEKAIA